MLQKKTAIGIVLCLGSVIVAGTFVAYAAGIPKEAKYAGTSKCRLCHLKQYKTWSKTKHARNFEVLQGSERKNPECLKCHTVGFGQPGGFVSEQATPGLKNTGCESCHGPGSAHIQAAKKAAGKLSQADKKINRVPRNACIKCHNPHISQKERVAKLRAAAK